MRRWFDDYVATFAPSGEALSFPLQLKVDHSRRVAWECREMAAELDWPLAEVRTARAAGLLHDVGRFSQYAEFGTFLDGRSVDHGERGFEVLSALKPLAPRAAWNTILASTRYHNRRFLPDDLDERMLPTLRLVRDADKLDILRVVNELVRTERIREFPGVLLNVHVDGPPSSALVRELREHRSGSYANVRSLADMHLIRLMWVYHLNYLPALRRMAERGYLEDLTASLADEPLARDLIDEARQFLARRLAEAA